MQGYFTSGGYCKTVPFLYTAQLSSARRQKQFQCIAEREATLGMLHGYPKMPAFSTLEQQCSTLCSSCLLGPLQMLPHRLTMQTCKDADQLL